MSSSAEKRGRSSRRSTWAIEAYSCRALSFLIISKSRFLSSLSRSVMTLEVFCSVFFLLSAVYAYPVSNTLSKSSSFNRIDSIGSCERSRTGLGPGMPGKYGLGGGARPETSLSIAWKKSLSLLSLKARTDAVTRSLSRIS